MRRARRRARAGGRAARGAALRAAITAVVSVADDGGSSGRLRRDLDVLPPGDLRRCLVALADDPTVGRGVRAPLRRRRARGSRARQPHPRRARRDARRLRRRARRGRPSARRGRAGAARRRPSRSSLKAEIGERRERPRGRGPGRGAEQPRHPPGRARPRRRARATRRARRDRACRPDRARAGLALHEPAPGAVRARDPRGGRRDAGPGGAGRQPAPQMPETDGLDGIDHLRAVLDHGARVDAFLSAEDGTLAVRPRRCGRSASSR